MPVAEAAGAHQHLFGQEDLHIVYLACDVARGKPLLTVLRIAREALREAGYWSPAGAISSKQPWNDESLALLAGGYFYSSAVVYVLTRRLIDLEARQHGAEDAYRKYQACLAGDLPAEPMPARQPVFVLRPSRRGAA